VLPAWNDEGYSTRLRFASRLAAAGIGSYLLEAPFYGRRRAAPGGSPVRTVADFALLSRSVVEEGRALVAGLAAGGRPVGVAGYSMGGSLAATVGATLDLPMAIAPLAAAHAPAAVFTEGVIRNAVAWDALGRGGRGRLAEVLLRPSLLRVPPTVSTRHAVLVAATGDGFVSPGVTEAIHAHWPGSELRWVRAGHATLLWRRIDVLVGAIVDAFARSKAGG
jgi:alpha-beta hydrolase superfamily lysophospholipase